MPLTPQKNPKHFICQRCGNTLKVSCPMRKSLPCASRETRSRPLESLQHKTQSSEQDPLSQKKQDH